MIKLTAPYRFFPLEDEIHYPHWQDIAFDIPAPDALTGTLELTLKAHSPILVGASRQVGNQVHFFKTPDGHYAIPGSTLRGYMRGLMETLTKARLTQMEADVQLSYRDLSNENYKDHLTKKEDDGYRPLSKAGWLDLASGDVYPVEHYRVEIKDIESVFRKRLPGRIKAEEQYDRLGNRIPPVYFTPGEERSHPHSQGAIHLIYKKAGDLSKEQGQKQEQKLGYLILTGRPGDRKHMQFIFLPPSEETKKLPDEVRKQFQYIYENSTHLAWLLRHSVEGKIPVFYVEDGAGQIKYMGLSQMFRFPYKYKVGDKRPRAHKEPEGEQLDFVQLLFGTTETNPARKGRLSFGLLQGPHEREQVQVGPYSVILSSPKSSFYPTYLDQSKAKSRYFTWNDDDAVLAGRKFYPPHKEGEPVESALQNEQNQMTTTLHPLQTGTTFSGVVRFHNVLPEELGALLLLLTLGEIEPNKRFHTLGMGKPYGFGKSQIHVSRLDIAYGDSSVTVQSLIARFLQYALKNGLDNEGLDRFVAMLASFYPAGRGELKALQLKPDNQFNLVKKQAPETLSEIGKYDRDACKKDLKSLLDNLKQEGLSKTGTDGDEDNNLPHILKIPFMSVKKQDLEQFYEQVDDYPSDVIARVREHIESSNWWKGLNSKVRKKNRSKYPKLFE